MSAQHVDLVRLLSGWPEADRQQALLRQRYLAFAERGDASLRKPGGPVHFTASLLPFSDDLTRVLLVFHKKARRWLQPGGHIEEADASILAAARREGVEECGVAIDDTLVPAQLDAHELGGGFACHEHLDIRFAVRVPGDAVPHVSDESEDVRWFAVDDELVLAELGALVNEGLVALRGQGGSRHPAS